MTLQAIIVDDEPLARARIRDLLQGQQEINVRAECSSGTEALAAIERLDPDLVFLDIQMPDLDGFGVLDRLPSQRHPAVIFVTAFDDYAVKAFDTTAVDYLLKPVDRRRFDRAVSKAIEHCQQHTDAEAPATNGHDEPARRDRLVVRNGSTVHFVKVADIDWIEAARNYVRLHAGRDVYTMRETMAGIEAKLDSGQFVRIHRSTIVNIDRIRRIFPGFGTQSILELDDGTRLMVSRAYRRGKIRQLFG